MRTSIRTLLFVTLLLIVSCGSASAATLTTPLIFAANGLLCVATNLDTEPLAVAVTVTDSSGAAVATTTDTCNGTPVAPKSSCHIAVNPPSSPLVAGFCSFTASGKKFRGVGYGDTATTSIALPATK